MPNTRTLLIAIALTCFALIGAALYLQHVKGLLPCPLCVGQRYAFLLAGIFALVGAFTSKPKPWAALGLASALGGIVVVGRHLWILANPGLSCGVDPVANFLNKIPAAEVLPWVFEADGMCEDALDTILGLSIPQWSAVWFVILCAALLTVLVRRR